MNPHRLRNLILAASAALLVSASAPSTRAAAQERALLVRVERRPVTRSAAPNVRPEPFQVQIEVFRTGRAVREGVAIQLTPAQVASVRRLVSRTRFRMERRPRPVCAGFPSHDVRVSTHRASLVFQMPCAPPPDASVDALLAGLDEHVRVGPPATPTNPPPVPGAPNTPPPSTVEPAAPSTDVLVRFSQRRATLEAPSDILVYTDGRAVLGARTLQLPPGTLASLRAQLREVSFAREGRPAPCGAAYEGEAVLEVSGVGTTRWSLPCGQPSASVSALLARLRRLGDET